MKECIVFIMTPFLSHIIPTYKLARHFQKRGYQVLYVSTKKLEEEITGNGFTFQDSFVVSEDRSVLKTKELIRYILEKYSPKICLVELSFWNWALFLSGMKQKFLLIQTWPCCNKAPYLLPTGYRATPKRNLFTFVKNELSWRKQNKANRQLFNSGDLNGHYTDVVKNAGLDPSVSYITMENRISHFKILNATELVLFPAEFDFPRKADPLTRFIGPFVDTERREGEFRWPGPGKTDSPVIFCSLGSMSSIFKNKNSFYDRVIEGFRQRQDLTLIMSVGKNNKYAGDANLPPNIHLCEYAPQLKILAKTAVFITHGGAGSVREALYFGVPMLVYPWQSRSDMYGNADRVVFHNLGQLGDIEKDSATVIMQRIDKLLHDSSIKQSSSRMKNIFREYEKREPEMIELICSAML